ncbi:DUF222 domain-containing protein [Nocardia sp. NPDC020380]|uniref:HNH endonuclease signature motif containing protein n=1 Tax=Nocardia sp. NPDC020380 TaxID=3364309 RepID=UPI0037A6922D
MGTDADAAIGMAVDQLTAAIAAVSGADLTALSDADLVAVARRFETCKRQLSAVDTRFVVEAMERGLPHKHGESPTGLLRTVFGVSTYEAGQRLSVARQCGRLREIDGHLKPAVLESTGAAFAEGAISRDHVRGIVEVMKGLPEELPGEDRGTVEEILVQLSRSCCPDDLPRVGREILARVDPEGKFCCREVQQRRRGIHLGRQQIDGMSYVEGWLTPEVRAVIDAVLAKFARPGMCNPDDPHSPHTTKGIDSNTLDAAAARDRRDAAQRNHDALLGLLAPQVSASKLGTHRGVPVQAIITMSLAELEEAAGIATTASGGHVSIPDALRLAEKSKPILALFNHDGMPLHMGRSERLATPAQRYALIASERGCTRPGCDAPAALCQVHHITEWADGGPTDIDNLTLACDHCHALVNDSDNGWKTVVMGKDSQFPGRTGWIAPTHIDPSGVARVNHRHHPEEQIARVTTAARARHTRLRGQRCHTNPRSPSRLQT